MRTGGTMADLVVTAEAFGAIHTGFEQLYQHLQATSGVLAQEEEETEKPALTLDDLLADAESDDDQATQPLCHDPLEHPLDAHTRDAHMIVRATVEAASSPVHGPQSVQDDAVHHTAASLLDGIPATLSDGPRRHSSQDSGVWEEVGYVEMGGDNTDGELMSSSEANDIGNGSSHTGGEQHHTPGFDTNSSAKQGRRKFKKSSVDREIAQLGRSGDMYLPPRKHHPVSYAARIKRLNKGGKNTTTTANTPLDAAGRGSSDSADTAAGVVALTQSLPRKPSGQDAIPAAAATACPAVPSQPHGHGWLKPEPACAEYPTMQGGTPQHHSLYAAEREGSTGSSNISGAGFGGPSVLGSQHSAGLACGGIMATSHAASHPTKNAYTRPRPKSEPHACAKCGTRKSTYWRRGADGRAECNKCALGFADSSKSKKGRRSGDDIEYPPFDPAFFFDDPLCPYAQIPDLGRIRAAAASFFGPTESSMLPGGVSQEKKPEIATPAPAPAPVAPSSSHYKDKWAVQKKHQWWHTVSRPTADTIMFQGKPSTLHPGGIRPILDNCYLWRWMGSADHVVLLSPPDAMERKRRGRRLSDLAGHLSRSRKASMGSTGTAIKMESIPSSDAAEKEKRGSSAAIFLARNTAMVQRISGPLREEETAKVVKALKHPSLPPTPMEAAKRQASDSLSADKPVKRGRGRPRKYPLPVPVEELSEYERQRHKNIAENMMVLERLGIADKSSAARGAQSIPDPLGVGTLVGPSAIAQPLAEISPLQASDNMAPRPHVNRRKLQPAQYHAAHHDTQGMQAQGASLPHVGFAHVQVMHAHTTQASGLPHGAAQ